MEGYAVHNFSLSRIYRVRCRACICIFTAFWVLLGFAVRYY